MSSAAPRPPDQRRGVSNATWLLGVAAIIALTYITLNTLRTEAPGAGGLPRGTKLPPFAAPLAASDLEGDAAVEPEARDGQRAACTIRGPKILNICELAERGPVVLAFTASRSKRCEDAIDDLERVAARHPDVEFAAVAIRGSRKEVRKIVLRHGWKLPVGHDRDGAVSNIYGVAVCPSITFARAGGAVVSTTLGEVEPAEIERRIAEIVQ